jgi:TonB family protein
MSPAAFHLLAVDLLRAATFQVLYSTVLAAAVMLTLRLLRVRAPLVREAAWLLVLLRLVVSPDWFSRFSLRGLLDPWVAAAPASSAERLALAVVASGQSEHSAAQTTMGWQGLVVLVWALVAVALTTLLLLRMRHYHRISRHAAPVDDPVLLGLVASWRSRLGVRRTVRLVTSGASLAPFTTGCLRPTIFLPRAVLGCDQRTIESIIGHEMVHISRWDELRILVANLVRTIHFYNPVAWLAVMELGQAREERCDEVVVRTGVVAARDYRRSLVDILKLSQCGQPAVDALAGLIDRKEGIKMRVVSIQNEALPKNLRPWPIILCTIVAAVLLVPMAPADNPTAASQSQDQGSASLVAHMKGRVEVIFASPERNVRPPIRIEGDDPKYTDKALTKGTTGTVKLEMTVGVDGSVKDVRVLHRLPHGLTEATLKAVQGWRFRPAQNGGIAVELTTPIAVVFRLYDSTPRELDTKLLTEIEPLLPAEVTLTSLTTDGGLLHLEGLAGSTDQVSELLQNLDGSSSFTHIDLESLIQNRDGFKFSMTCEKLR